MNRKLKITLLAGSGVAAATTLTLIYAKYDKNFREQLSAYLPFINSLLSDEQQQQRIDAARFDDSFMKKTRVMSAEKKVAENTLPKLPEVPIVPVPAVKQLTKEDKEPLVDVLEEKTIKKEIAKTFEKAINEENIIVCILIVHFVCFDESVSIVAGTFISRFVSFLAHHPTSRWRE